MREVKFRARNANLPRCWIYGYFVIERDQCFIINDEGKFQVIAGTESQYMEIKDKHKKELYMEDTVKITSNEGNKHMDEDKFKIKDINDWCYLVNNQDIFTLEFIKDPYEHPELLK